MKKVFFKGQELVEVSLQLSTTTPRWQDDPHPSEIYGFFQGQGSDSILLAYFQLDFLNVNDPYRAFTSPNQVLDRDQPVIWIDKLYKEGNPQPDGTVKTTELKGAGFHTTAFALQRSRELGIEGRIACLPCYGSGQKWLNYGFRPVDGMSEEDFLERSKLDGDAGQYAILHDTSKAERIIQEHFTP
ncbi:hypothetical protein ACFL0V_04325 [Nanoarchaeota archaeon]